MEDPERERTYRWHDPLRHWSRLGKVSGLDYLTMIIRGEVPPPPVATSLRLTLLEASKGRILYVGEPGEDFANDVGSVQGGWLAALIDASIGSAVHSILSPGQSYTTVELKINYVRPVAIDSGKIKCLAETLYSGRRTATAKAEVLDSTSKLCAHATTTCLILPLQNS